VRGGYTSSKDTLLIWVQHAAVELGNTRRIRLNATGPSPTQTAFVDMSSEIITDEFITARPFPSLGRIATAEEQA
jgi:NAD(P)-dependent dehydrogenase (short-subunit alcohol dehydrogenase family)